MRRISLVAAVLALLVGPALPLAPAGAIAGFGDVPGGVYYSDAVQWLSDQGLVQGTSPGCFSPGKEVTRGELATIVWREAGRPAGGSHPFVDVSAGAYYAQPVGWMYRTHLTTGTTPTTYAPGEPVTRAEAATFLWRMSGSPSAPASGFVDVARATWYTAAVDWFVDTGVTTGTSPTTFTPDRAISRAEFATFLYRLRGAPAVSQTASVPCNGSTAGAGPASPSTPSTPSTPTSPLPPANAVFFEDFSSSDSVSRFDFDIYHRDDYLVTQNSWMGDHSITGPGDLCGPPEEKRVITRGSRSSDFNDDWFYRCVPGGDLGKAHVMTSIGDTSGYSIGAFSPAEVFTDVREVRWDVNLTDLGTRQFPEVKIIPADRFDFQDLPCAIEWLPCDTSTHGELGSVGTSFFDQELAINNGATTEIKPGTWRTLEPGDPAIDSIRTRRAHFFRDNGNGTLTLGVEGPNGGWVTFTTPGSFPDGPVRVVFADHNYTPTKDNPGVTFTWHWDNISVIA